MLLKQDAQTRMCVAVGRPIAEPIAGQTRITEIRGTPNRSHFASASDGRSGPLHTQFARGNIWRYAERRALRFDEASPTIKGGPACSLRCLSLREEGRARRKAQFGKRCL